MNFTVFSVHILIRRQTWPNLEILCIGLKMVRFSKIFEKIKKSYLGYNEPDCIARQRTAIIIPYRSREQQLTQERLNFDFYYVMIYYVIYHDVMLSPKKLLEHLNPILRKQQISYQVNTSLVDF